MKKIAVVINATRSMTPNPHRHNVLRSPRFAASRCLLFFAALLPLIELSATVVQLTEVSEPVGLVDTTRSVETAVEITSSVAPWENSGYRFTEWTLNGVRFADAVGRATNPVSLTLYQPETLVAHYLLPDADTDMDGILDWQEVDYFGDLTRNAISDDDADGLGLADELLRMNHPNLADEMVEGGTSLRMGSMATVILNSFFIPYSEVSVPAGLHAFNAVVESGTTVQLSAVAEDTSGYRFIGWYMGFFRLDSPYSSQPPYMNISMETTFEARYIEALEDMDGDGIEDWYEQFHYTTLDNDGASDTDGDGIALDIERLRGDLPTLHDEHAEGGISFRASGLIQVDLSGLASLVLLSDPPGFQDDILYGEAGTVVQTPDLWNVAQSGYRFAYWNLDGLRQVDSSGASLGKLSVTLVDTHVATAHYIEETLDSDLDGIVDWREYFFYGSLDNNATADTDLDGLDFDRELIRGNHPGLPDEMVEGGISFRLSSLALVDMQLYERLRFGLVDGVLQEIFSENPNTVTGWSFAPVSAPSMGDWDNDGDLDLFIVHDNGLSVYENTGTRFTMDFTNRSTGFSTLSGSVQSMSRPYPALGDWNGDGRDDLALGGDGGLIACYVSPGNFNGLSTPSFFINTGSASAIPAFGEFTGDTLLDMIVLLANGTIRLYPNNGTSAAFSTSTYTDNLLGQVINNASGVAAADLDLDGLSDLLVADADGRVYEFYGLEGGGYSLLSKVWGGTGAGFAANLTIAAVDVDGDGDTDLITGSANGGITLLRDPGVGRPNGLMATPGYNSIQLDWDPDWQSRIRGYQVYRSGTTSGPWNALLEEPLSIPGYLDSPLSPGTTQNYVVTGISYFFTPGNSNPRFEESLPSEIVTETAGKVNLGLRSVKGTAGSIVSIPLALDNALGLTGEGLSLEVAYDSTKLLPADQASAPEATVLLTGLSEQLTISHNGDSATGTLVITGTGGSLEAGSGKLFTLRFKILESMGNGNTTTLAISSASLDGSDGQSATVSISSNATITIDSAYTAGDVDGNGTLDSADKSLLKVLTKPASRTPSTEEISAGDLNGDGQLNPEDLVLLNRLLEGLDTP